MKNSDAGGKWTAERAFVLQFDSNGEPGRGRDDPASGRVEHVVSGRALRFRSFDELRSFLAAVLRETSAGEGEAK
jgi:hypothetical protein